MPGRSSGPRRQWQVATGISRRCSTTIVACPCDATRCGRCCTISIVGPRMGRHRRRGFSDGRFPICSSVCCHGSTRCPCQGNVVRPSRQVLEEAGGPALNGVPFGGIPLRRQKEVKLIDRDPPHVYLRRNELIKRLLTDACELCASTTDCEVHHVRKLADLKTQGRAEKPLWIRVMASRRRKTLVVCRRCHEAIHAGRPLPQRVSA